jgi:isoleucyl-tRNA synthetase
MSKSKGNVIDPFDVLDTKGADVLRWWMVSQGSPWTPTRVSIEAIDPAFLVTLWNTVGFFLQYASLNTFDPATPTIPSLGDRPPMDRWALSRLSTTIKEVTVALDDYEPLDAALSIAGLVDDISNWYVRRSRRRFWRTDPNAPQSDSLGAQATLHHVLATLCVLLAPFCPFVADALWRALTDANENDSVHLASWPTLNEFNIDAELEEQMEVARRLSSLGRAARAEAGVRVRQPLKRALVHVRPGAPPILPGIVEDELNVDRVEIAIELGAVLRFELVPKFPTLGPKLGDRVKDVRPALQILTDEETAAAADALESGGSFDLLLGEASISLGPDDIDIRVKSQPGFAVSREASEVVALDLAITEDLQRRGDARELVRYVQELRKESGLAVSDRIRLFVDGADHLSPLFPTVAQEVLATEIIAGHGDGPRTELPFGGGISLEKALI